LSNGSSGGVRATDGSWMDPFGSPMRSGLLWILGNVDGVGGKGPIYSRLNGAECAIQLESSGTSLGWRLNGVSGARLNQGSMCVF
jgi:hypothetical protein